MNILQNLKESDPVISNFINSEKNRQETHLELIASENFASIAVMQAQGSVLTNKYAEGLPQKRYYGGCEFVDEIEELAIQRAKNYLMQIGLMCNPIVEHRQMLLFSLVYLNLATQSWGWIYLMVDI